MKREIIFTTIQKWWVRVGEALHNYEEELHYSHPLSILSFFLQKTIDYRFDNQAFVDF